MKYTTRRMRIALLLLGAVLTVTAHAQKHGIFAVNGKTVRVAEFDERVNSILEDSGVPGMSLAVIDHDKVVYSQSYGVKEHSRTIAVDDATVFEAASLTKTFLVFVVYKLAEQGKIDLDKPMYQYMEFPMLQHDERYKLITARMVLNHTAGVENWKRYNNPDLLEIVSTPGQGYSYSGEAYQYLSQVVEKILGKSYDAYIRKMVVKPLRLKHTYTAYTDESPDNYAIGHNSFGQALEKWKNTNTEPASGIHLSAKDYATLIVSLFKGKHFSETFLHDLQTGSVSVDGGHQYAGPGFAVLRTANDTTLLHGGSNEGFRAFVGYSLHTHSGLVFLTNSERGDLLTKTLNELLPALDINEKFAHEPMAQYPSHANSLLKVFNTAGSEEMLRTLDIIKQNNQNAIGEQTLNELGYLFFTAGNNRLAEKLFQENINLYPESSIPNYFLGIMKFQRKDFDVAYNFLQRAKDLHFEYASVDGELSYCNQKIQEAREKKFTIVKIRTDAETLLEGENYKAMSGVESGGTNDEGGGMALGYIEDGNWMDYAVAVATPGAYQVEVRVASEPGNGILQFKINEQILGSVSVPATGGWGTWQTISTQIYLPEGEQSLRVFDLQGSLNLNWIKFTRIKEEASR